MNELCRNMITDANKLQCLNDSQFWELMIAGTCFVELIVAVLVISYTMVKLI